MVVHFGDAFQHLAENESSAFLRLRNRVKHNLFGNPLDFNVHLNRGDALFGTGHLEVHIAEEVLKSLNIRHNHVFAGFGVFDKSHRAARHRRLNRHAGVHQRHRGTAYGSHRRRTVRRKNIRYHADGVREFFFRRNHGYKRAFRKSAVSDFAATGAS